MIGTLTRRSMRARAGRNIFIGLAIMLGVSFVAGSFVLADSLKATFDNLFTELNQDVDFQVRTELTVDSNDAVRDPVPASLAEEIAQVDGVSLVEGGLARYAQLLQPDGEPVSTRGAPALGLSWSGPDSFAGVVLKDGRAPNGIGEVVIDKATADRVGFAVGDPIDIVFDGGQQSFTIVGLVGLGNSDGFGGATTALFDPESAQTVLDAAGQFDVIDLQIAEGADPAAVQAAVEQILPDRLEVVTGEQVGEETADSINSVISIFGTGLLVFAFVTAFVSAFIINNVFGITISQRLRELALLRAVGANSRQIRKLIIVEALIISVTATIVGVFGGLFVANALIALFDAAGAGFPPTPLQMQFRTVVVAAVVGVGITLLSVLIPAGRAARIPPVAAMRPETGFGALSANRRLVRGVVITAVGTAMFLIGLFFQPGGSSGLIAFAGGGALAIFLGVSSVSSTVARPVSAFIGAPVRRLFGVPGQLAVDNAGRVPRRTARTASALMIGVAMVSAAAVFASSLRDTFGRVLDRAITADYVITDESFQGLPPAIGERIAAVPEISAVSPFRPFKLTSDGSDETAFAIDPITFPDLADLGIDDGDYQGLVDGDGVMLLDSEAEDRAVGVGDTLNVTWQNGVDSTLTVSGLFTEQGLPGTWYVSTATLESVSDQPPRDQFVLARLADGADPDVARFEINDAIAEYPQAEVRSNAEFRAEQEGQINQLLAVITGLLSMAMAIAVIGIAITLALSVFERTREIGLLRAVGTTRRQLKRAIRWESVIVSVFGAVVGVAVGLLLGVALSYAVPNTVIDGITLPFGTVIAVLIGSVAAGVVAAVYPARKASRMDVLRAITTE